MIDPHVEDLLTREADGLLDPQETSELDDLVRGNDEATRARVDQRAAVAHLAGVTVGRPPLDLTHSVMAVVRASSKPQGALRGRPSWRYAAALAAGLVLGAFVMSLGRLQEPPGSAAASMGMVPSSGRLIDQKSLQDAGMSASVQTRRLGSRVLVEIQTGSSDIGAQLSFGRGLLPVGFERAAGAPGELFLGTSEARLSGGGPGTYRLILEVSDAASPGVQVLISQGGRSLEAVVATAAP